MPAKSEFIPKQKKSFWGGDGGNGERKKPKGDRTRRMEMWEGEDAAGPGGVDSAADLD